MTIDSFFITITNRDITKQTDQYLSQKNQEFNDLNKAVMQTLKQSSICGNFVENRM